MESREHIDLLLKDVSTWNAWRSKNFILPDLSGADLRKANLRQADLRRANLSNANLLKADLGGANLRDASLSWANMREAKMLGSNLSRADLSHAMLSTADLNGADLRHANMRSATLNGTILNGADLRWAKLDGSNLRWAKLGGADLSRTNLSGVDLSEADLSQADCSEAILRQASLIETNLRKANLRGCDLYGATLSRVVLGETIFGNVDLTTTIGLETCIHWGPSTLDYQTLQKSGPLPLAFLRGVGLPDNLIDYLPSLLNEPIQFYSCFISYSSRNQDFAERLYADLQNNGVRCWFALHDMPIGAKILDTIDEAIRLRDKVLLILSEGAIASDWVEDEVSKAFAEERERKQIVLFPIRLDDAVRQNPEPWARKLRDQRHIGDFTRWKDHDAYRKSFERLMRNLTIKRTHDGSASWEGA